MKQIMKFVAHDGKEFKTKRECQTYEDETVIMNSFGPRSKAHWRQIHWPLKNGYEVIFEIKSFKLVKA